MIKRPTFFAALAFLFIVLLSVPALALPSTVPPTPKAYTFQPIADQINQQIQSLIGGTTTPTAPPPTASPATNNAAPAAPAAAPGAAPAAAPPANGEEQPVEPTETFGTRVLSLAVNFANMLVQEGTTFVEDFTDQQQVRDWVNRQISVSVLQDRWRAAGQDLLLVVGIAFAAAFVLEILLLPVRRNIRHRKPKSFLRQCGLAFGMLAVELLPVILFVIVSVALLNQHEAQRLPRFVVESVVYAITLNRLLILLGMLLLAPKAPSLRLVPVSQPQAQYLYHWLGIFSFVAVYGYFCVDLARSLHVPAQAIDAFGSLLALILVVMTIAVIVQKRAYIAVLLRGDLSAAQRDLTFIQGLRLWFARSWHALAIAYLVIGYLVTALGGEGGVAALMRSTVLTFLVFVLTGLAFYAASRWSVVGREDSVKPQLHQPILRLFLHVTIWAGAIAGVAAAWGADIFALFETTIGKRVINSFFFIGITVVVLALIHGFVTNSIERHLNRKDKEGRPIPASARMRTLLPMLHSALFIVFSVVAGLVILEEVGMNTLPLFAGVIGIVGVAVGLGSQTLVKDFITGLFIVIENTIAIGDVVKIGDDSGVVEAMTIRTLRLRDSDGAVHILPFSEVTKIINMTRDFAYALINIGVAYDSDLRHAMELIKQVGEEMQKDPKFRNSILDPIEVFGVDKLGDSSVILQARIRTRAGRQWDVKRALLLHIKERFDKEKIEIPLPTVMNVQKAAKT